MWIARDLADDSIWLYNYKPEIDKSNTYFDCKRNSKKLQLTDFKNRDLKIFFGIDNLTFENSPIEIEVKAKQK